MSELGGRPKLRFWTQMSGKQTRKIGLQEFSVRALEPLRDGKKNMSGLGIDQF